LLNGCTAKYISINVSQSIVDVLKFAGSADTLALCK